jgi:pSer/pThr/pTyr-binding forkhead associated (FHA) protein
MPTVASKPSRGPATPGRTPRKITIDINDRRFPRHGVLRWARTVLLGCWFLIATYLGAVALNVFQVLGQDPSRLQDRLMVVHAMLLPDALARQDTPLVAFLPFLLLFLALLAGCLWALRDLARERNIEQLREARLVAQRMKDIEAVVTRTMQPLRDASLLVVPIDGSIPATRTPLTTDAIAIGRDTSNDLVVPDPTVSRQHLRLTREGSLWRVVALPDSSPLRLNGRETSQAVLRDGDQLIIGATILRFEASSVPGQTMAVESVPYLAVSCATVSFLAPLRDAEMTLGRDPDCAIVVPSPIVSHHHATLVRNGDGNYTVDDDTSRNGLRFERKPISTHPCRDGDQITIGERSGVEIVTLIYLTPQDATIQPAADIAGVETLIPASRARRMGMPDT